MSLVIASFRHECDAIRCVRYARGRYPEANVQYSGMLALKFPYAVTVPDTKFQLAIAFIKGFAYALGQASQITEVQCRGDERERYDVVGPTGAGATGVTVGYAGPVGLHTTRFREPFGGVRR